MLGNKSIDTTILLHSISEVESRNRIEKIGDAGERTQYQFMEYTWRQYSKVPFSKAGLLQNQPEVKRVAQMHVKTIIRILGERGREVTPYNIALAWNGGPDRLIYLSRHKDYARRVANLYVFYLQ